MKRGRDCSKVNFREGFKKLILQKEREFAAMEYFWIVLPKMGGFLFLVFIGFTAVRLGIVKKEAMPSISGFLIKVVLPALVISLIWENHTTVFSMIHYGRIVLWQIGAYLLLAGTGILVSRIFKLPESIKNVYRGCMVGGNFGFLVIRRFGRGQVYPDLFGCRYNGCLDTWIVIVSGRYRKKRKSMEKGGR